MNHLIELISDLLSSLLLVDGTGNDSIAEDGVHFFDLEERVTLLEHTFVNASSGLVTALAYVE